MTNDTLREECENIVVQLFGYPDGYPFHELIEPTRHMAERYLLMIEAFARAQQAKGSRRDEDEPIVNEPMFYR